MGRKVVAIIGSYRKGGSIDSAVQAVLAGARESGAQTDAIYLTDKHLEFCTNCRQCTQPAGEDRGKCRQQDDLDAVLTELEAADAIVLASPVNYYNVTAIFRRFMERLLGYTFWPWGQAMPKLRRKQWPRRAALVASSAAPGFVIPLFFTGVPRALALTAKSLGAKPVSRLWIGLASGGPHQALPARTLARARRIGMKLAG